MALEWGTLVVAVTTKEGWVIAADSRWTARGIHIDYQQKIQFPRGRTDTAFALTGEPTLFKAPAPGIPVTAEWLRAHEPAYDARTVAANFLEGLPNSKSYDEANFDAVRSVLAESFDKFARENNEQKWFAGKPLFQLVLVQFNRKEPLVWTLASSLIEMSKGGRVTSSRFFRKFHADDQRQVPKFGESDYAVRYVLNGEGYQFLSPVAGHFWMQAHLIRDTSLPEAAEFARSLIEATSKMAEKIPPESGVGGPIVVYFIDGKNAPKKLQAVAQ